MHYRTHCVYLPGKDDVSFLQFFFLEIRVLIAEADVLISLSYTTFACSFYDTAIRFVSTLVAMCPSSQLLTNLQNSQLIASIILQ